MSGLYICHPVQHRRLQGFFFLRIIDTKQMHGNLLRPLLELIEKEEEAKDEKKIIKKTKNKKQNK